MRLDEDKLAITLLKQIKKKVFRERELQQQLTAWKCFPDEEKMGFNLLPSVSWERFSQSPVLSRLIS